MGSPEDRGRVAGQGAGSEPMGLCHVGVCWFGTGVLDSQAAGPSGNPDFATLAWDLGGHICG